MFLCIAVTEYALTHHFIIIIIVLFLNLLLCCIAYVGYIINCMHALGIA